MSEGEELTEAQRQFNVCNACRYCEGYCAVFPAAELRTTLGRGDLTYLANLCHDCRDCYDACMFAPPHEFAINIPQLLAEARVATYERYSRPRIFARLFRAGTAGTLAVVLVALSIVLAAVLATSGRAGLFAPHTGPGAFYRVLPFLGMVVPALTITLYGVLVVVAGMLEFTRDIRGAPSALDWRALGTATVQALTLRYLKGGGAGCYYPRERGSSARRVLHGFVFWGFIGAFVSTVAAAVMQDVLGILPPFAWLSAPVLLGSVGGLLLVAGCTGLIVLKSHSDAAPAYAPMTAMDYAFLLLLDAVAITGMLTLFLRGTSALGASLTLHLGLLAGLYLTAPYGKFVHFVYRYLALVKRAAEEAAEPAR